ncbi:MAG TPA: glycosyltransferase [Candidatus Limnocylindria bacterium]|nr:glycosyltransferase [Candidatus Limnocylindria bacterium]
MERGEGPITTRVAILGHASFPDDTRLRRQAEALRDAGYGVDVFALRDAGQAKEEDWRGVRVLRLPVRRAFTGFAGHLGEYLAFAGLVSLRLAAEHRRRRYRLVQVATLPDFLAFAALPVRLTGAPLLLDMHEDMPEFFRDRFGTGGLQALLPVVSAATRASAAVADEMITVHEPLRQLALARGVPTSRVSVVMDGADERLFDPARYTRHPLMADGKLRLIHHSNLQRIYGLDVAVAAMRLLDVAFDAHLDVYGDGPFRPDVETAISRHGVGDRVTLHGRVPQDDLPGLLAAADIGIVPSRPEPYMAYSLSTKLLEYVAMGVPVIATDLRTFRAHFDASAIRYVPGNDPWALADAIADLARNPEAAAASAAEGSRQARPYAWAVQRARYLAIVERLVARGRLGASSGA